MFLSGMRLPEGTPKRGRSEYGQRMDMRMMSFETLLGELRPEVVFLDKVLEKFCSMKEISDRYDKGNFGEGATPYELRSMLAIIQYGRWECITSLRRLSHMARTNLECMYLSGNVRPSHTAIGNFLREYKDIVDQFFAYTVQIAADNDMVAGLNVCIDGTRLGAWASTTKGLALQDKIRRLLGTRKKMEGYLKELGESDMAEEIRSVLIREAQEVVDECQKNADRFSQTVESMRMDGSYGVCVNDPDARRMVEGNTKANRAAHNIQAAVDDKANIVVAVSVTSDCTDFRQLQPMAELAKENLGALGIGIKEVTADQGYADMTQIESLESQGIDCNINLLEPHNKGFIRENVKITYDEADPAAAPAVTCPAGHVMSHSKTPGESRNQKVWVFYTSKPKCRACPLMSRCYPKGNVRVVSLKINVLQQKIDRHNEKMRRPDKVKRILERKGHGEAQFGYLKISREHRPLTRIGQDKARTDVKSTFATLNLKHVFNYFKGMLERITVRSPRLRPELIPAQT